MKKIAIIYNTSHYIILFRTSLIQTLQQIGYEIIAVAPKDEYSYKFNGMGVNYVSMDMDNKGINPFRDFILIFKLFSCFKRIKPDIILNYTIKPNIYGSIAASLLKIPVINNVTGLGTSFLSDGVIRTISQTLYRLAFRTAKMVFFQNQNDYDYFVEKQIVSINNSHILPGSGVDTDKFIPIRDSSKNDKFTFIMIARLIKDKGVLEYVEAVKILKSEGLDFNATLLGQIGVNNRSAISREQLDEWTREQYITYLGECEDVRVHIASSDCVVLPSYREGTSKVLLEAASMEKPIIASDVPGCNNVVMDGVNGLLCQPRNCLDLASKMKKMISISISEREIFGVQGRKMMVECFDEKVVIQKYVEIIQSIQ